jgi:uncharacterized protein YggT (Ycf19 family)
VAGTGADTKVRAEPTGEDGPQVSGNTSGSSAALTVLRAITWLVYAFAVAAIIVLAFAFVLAMLGASSGAAFSDLIYDTAEIFMRPFAGMITPTELANGGIIVWAALIAVAAYAVLAAIIGSLLAYISRSLHRSQAQDAQAGDGREPSGE